jgi:hypothetical protein
MRRSRPTDAALLGLLVPVLAAGCGGGPVLRVRAAEEDSHPHVFFTPTRDGAGRALPATWREQAIGDVPTAWPIPEKLLGGAGRVHLIYPDQAETEAWITLRRDQDTFLTLAKPPVARK